MIKKLRYFMTRTFFFALGIKVSKWRRHVSVLWSMGNNERDRTLEKILQTNKPTNAAGVEVTSLAGIKSSPLLSKGRYRQLSRDSKRSGVFKRKTSGTTGEPTTVKLSRGELSQMLGVRDYCYRHYGVRVGDREARFWGRPESGFKSNLKNFILNRKVCFPSGERAGECLAKILNWEPDYLYGYASLLIEAAVLIEKNSLNFKPPKCVICTAETILPAQKVYLARIFNAPVAEEYGATEFDIIAFECSLGHRHLVNPWLIVAQKDESLLITDTSRKSTSLVNYELGDTGMVKVSGCSELGGPYYLKDLTGRSINRFVYADSQTKFHSVNLSYAINEFQNKERKVFRFQIVQNEYGVLDVYVSDDIQNRSKVLEEYMENYLWKKTGNNIEVNVLANENSVDRSSKSYFIQNIDVSIENLA